jgi:carboxymethylenebutenolidase
MKEFETNIATGDGDMDTFVCHPDEGGPFPAVIMYMDAPGIREELRDMARRIGTAGYYVILPNLYYRWGCEDHYGFDRTRIREDEKELQKMYDLMNAATTEKIIADTGPMIEFLRNESLAKDGPIGAVGYCMSGKYIVGVGAAFPDEFAALASYYGVGIQTEEVNSPHLSAHKIKGELYLAFAEEDIHVPALLLKNISEAMEKAGVNCRVEVYPGTEHGFAFPQRPVYVKPAAERHWERMLSLFARNLRG